MNNNASVRLSDEEIQMIEEIKKTYKTKNISQTIKLLIHKEAEQIKFYTTNKNISDKYLFNAKCRTNVEQIRKGESICELQLSNDQGGNIRTLQNARRKVGI